MLFQVYGLSKSTIIRYSMNGGCEKLTIKRSLWNLTVCRDIRSCRNGGWRLSQSCHSLCKGFGQNMQNKHNHSGFIMETIAWLYRRDGGFIDIAISLALRQSRGWPLIVLLIYSNRAISRSIPLTTRKVDTYVGIQSEKGYECECRWISNLRHVGFQISSWYPPFAWSGTLP